MSFEERLELALGTPRPVESLRTLASDLLAAGHDRAKVLGMFEGARNRLRAAGREGAEDAVLDVMDFVNGWCSPHMKL
jgi:hypothetical protein